MLQPLNKYLVVLPIEEKRRPDDARILLPQDVNLVNFSHKAVKVIAIHAESELANGMKLLVPTSSVEEVIFLGKAYHIVPENHVIGFLKDNI
tara:strand:- start:250 stop:525 length:276 start_codon:yes stop_codon:yes gene_type:complete